MSILPLLFWLSLLLPGAAIARRRFPGELGGGVLASVGFAWMTSFIVLAPPLAIGYWLRVPMPIAAAFVAAAVAWGAIDLLRARAWTELPRALLSLACLGALVVAVDLVLSQRHGAILDNDARVHIARIRFLVEYGLGNADPFVRTPQEYPYPIYHTNIVHALHAIGSWMLRIDPVTMWFNSLAASKLMIASGFAYLAWAVLGGRWAAWIAAAMVIVNRAPYSFTLYPNQLAPWAVLPVAVGIAIRAIMSPERGESWGWRRVLVLVGGSAAVLGMTHPLYGGFLAVIAAPCALGSTALRLVGRRRGVATAAVAALAVGVGGLAMPLISRAMTAPPSATGLQPAPAFTVADDGATRDADSTQASAAAPRTRDRVSLVRPADGFTIYPRDPTTREDDWIARTLGRGFTGSHRIGELGIPWWRVWVLAVGTSLAVLIARRPESLLLLAMIAIVVVVMSVPPLCTTALRFLGAQWVLGRFETLAFVLWIPLSVPAVAAALERARPWGLFGGAAAQALLTLIALPVALVHASHRHPYTLQRYWDGASASVGVRTGRQYSGLMRNRAWMVEALPRDAVVLAGPLTGTWIAMLHGASLVASERSSTGVPAGRQRHRHVAEMLDPETDEGRRSDLLRMYGVTHVVVAGTPPIWTRYWGADASRGHGHVAIRLRTSAAPGMEWLREVQIAALQTERGDPASAVRRLEGVLRSHPDSAEAWFALGNARRSLGEAAASTVAYRQAFELDRREPLYALMLGNAHFDLEEYDEAIVLFDRAHDAAMAEGDHAAAASAEYNRGNAHFMAARYRDAIAAYDAALALLPTHPRAARARALALERLVTEERPEELPEAGAEDGAAPQ